MVGPNFSGDSLIAIHNTSNHLIVLSVGESFVSVVFYYLQTPCPDSNPTTSGHTDKFSTLGLEVSEAQLRELTQDWKKQYKEVQKRMCQSKEFRKLQEDLRSQKWKSFKKFFRIRNLIIMLVAVIMLVALYALAYYLDTKNGQTVWVERYFSVGFSGIFVAIITILWNELKNNSQS